MQDRDVGAFRVCGVRIDGLTLNRAADQILRLTEDARSHAVHLCNAYVLSLAVDDPGYAHLLNRGDLNLPDGAPVAAVGRHMGFASLTGRASGPDLMLETIRRGIDRGTRHYLYGGSPLVVEQLEASLRSMAPGVEIVGVESPPFRPLCGDEERALVDRLIDSGADVVWIGLGTPKQDTMVDRLHRDVPSVLVPVGAAFDFLAGAKGRAPVWMQRANLEWAYRLATEPRRLGGRYVVGNSKFLLGAMRDRALVARGHSVDGKEVELAPVGTEMISPTRWRSRLGRALLLLDAIVIGLSSLLAFGIRASYAGTSLGPLNIEVVVPFLVLPLWLGILNAFGCHAPHYQNQGGEAFRRFLGATTVAVLVLGFLSFLLSLDLSRLYVGLLYAIVLILGTLARLGVRRQLSAARRRGRLLQRAMIVGADDEAVEVARAMQTDPRLGYQVLGFVDDDRDVGTRVLDDLEVLGATKDVLSIAFDRGAGLVVISPTAVPAGTLRDVTLSLEGSPVDLAVAPSLFQVVTRRVAVESVNNVPLLHVHQMRLVGWRALAKGTMDVILGMASFVLTLPVLAAGAVAVKLQRDGGPVFFRQERVGRDGRTFTLYKFRTMIPNAESLRDSVEELNEAGHIFFKVREDPRVTRIGRFLRRWSVDELPQLLNVLKGDMSLVGPRPGLPDEVERYDAWQFRRLRVKPGVTGVWQTSGRSHVPFDEAVRMDLFYIENWSVGYDLFLLAKTARAVLGGRGAY